MLESTIAGQEGPILDAGRAHLKRAVNLTRAYYFFFFAALGAIVPLFSVFLAESGMSGLEIGLISSLGPLIALASNPFWGAIADHWNAHRGVLAICAAVAGLSGLAFAFVSGFWAILITLLVVIFFRAPIGAILDSTAMSLVTRADISYGQMRAFGSIGWIVTSLSVGFLAGMAGIRTVFVLYAILLGIVCTILSLKMPYEAPTQRTSFREGLGTLLRRPAYRSLLVTMMCFGAASASQSNFLGLTIITLGGSTVLVGIANSASAFFELPVMFQGRHWFRFISERKTILITNLALGVIWLLMAFATSSWVIAALAAILGLFFALYWTSVVTYASRSAPAGMRASAQTIAQAAHGGLGWALGSAISGILWDAGGSHAVFLSAACYVMVGALVFWLGGRSQVA